MRATASVRDEAPVFWKIAFKWLFTVCSLTHNASAIAWFESLPFLPIYENGLEVVYLVLLEVGGTSYPVR